MLQVGVGWIYNTPDVKEERNKDVKDAESGNKKEKQECEFVLQSQHYFWLFVSYLNKRGDGLAVKWGSRGNEAKGKCLLVDMDSEICIVQGPGWIDLKHTTLYFYSC